MTTSRFRTILSRLTIAGLLGIFLSAPTAAAEPGDAPNRIATTFYGDTKSQRAFTWYSTAAGKRPVAVVSTDPNFAKGPSTIEFAGAAHTNAGGERLYRAIARKLAAATTYYYRVGFADTSTWSATGSFVTSDGKSDFTFIALADTQSSTRTEAELAAATLAKSLRVIPDATFVLHQGDLVEHGELERDWIDLLDASSPSLLMTTIAPAAGDRDQAPNAFTDHFTLDAPNGQKTTTGAYYSFDYNTAHVIVLNTNESAAQGIGEAQRAWLAADAKAARARGAKWVVLSMHKGPYTPANHMSDAEIVAMRTSLVPLIDALDIDLVLQGHDHILSRTKVLASDPNGIAGARVVDTARFTEMTNGKRIEYVIDPKGTIFLLPNTAGAKKSQQTIAADGRDLEPYFSLFDRLPDAAQPRETFAAIRVTADRLTVEQYDIRGGSSPRLFEGFGIDRQISPVDARIAALPAADAIKIADAATVAAAVAEARAAVDRLTPDQRRALPHLVKLEQVEHRLRVLQGLVADDRAGSGANAGANASAGVIAWADPLATSRQRIAIRNDTKMAFADAPIRVMFVSAPNVEAHQIAFFTPAGVPLPFEVETWERGQPSTVWVKSSSLPKRSTSIIWAYFGGGPSAPNDPKAVWSDGYSLVDHMNVSTTSGAARLDSTGKAIGRLRGSALASTSSSRGIAETRFSGGRLEYPGNIGGDYDRITISGIYTFTAEEAARAGASVPAAVIAKESATKDGPTAFAQAIGADNTVSVVLKGNSFQFPDIDDSRRLPLIADGRPHLVTQTYDGMTYSVFIDGREAYSTMIEYRTTFSDPRVLTTIGDRYTNDGSPSAPFHGSIDEVHIAGVAFTPEFEAFRYATYFGDAVTLGDLERATFDISAADRIELTAKNVVVRTGTTSARVPHDLTPGSGEASTTPTLQPTTVGDNANPYQIFEITLTAAQAARSRYHLAWRGAAGTRRVSAWVWNSKTSKWVLKDTGFSDSGGRVSLDVTALASEHAVVDGKLRLLIWRGLTALPWGDNRDFTRRPESGDYEWGLDHVGDTQLYSQATPARSLDQMEYVAAAAKGRKTALMVQVGDWVNREYYSQEYQWVAAEGAIGVIEKARIPYMIAWGNHDYSDLRNGRVMLPKYFPMSRLEASLAGSPWRFGGSDNIANYYYTGEIAGAKLLILTLGFWSVDRADDAGVAWAKQVIASHPDHTVIFTSHNAVGAGTNVWSNKVVAAEIVEPHDNVKLVLGGHIAGTGVAVNVNKSGRRAYGVLTDYQSRVYGGQEYLKHVSVDAENGLIYFNTWSPMLERAVSDGRWHQDVKEADVPGFHGTDTENYVIELDLGSRTTRTLATEALSVAAGR